MNALLLLCLAAPPAPPVTAAAYSPDGKTLLAGTRGEIAIVDVASGEPRAVHKTLAGRVTAVAWASNARFAVAAGEPGLSGVVRVYDITSARPLATWNAHGDTVFTLAFTPDGKTLATAGYDRVIKLWTVGGDTTKPAAELKDHSDAVYALSISPDGSLLASAGADRAVKVWDLKTGKRLYTLGDNTDWVYAVSWSPDGKRLTAAGVDKSLRVWKAGRTEGRLERSAFAHAGPVVKFAYTPDGKAIITAGEDRIVKLWDAVTLKEMATHPAVPDAILALAMSPKGDRVAVGRFDGVLAVVESKTGKPLQAVLPAKPRIAAASPMFLPRGRTTKVLFTGTGLDAVTGIAGPDLKVTLDDAKRTDTTLVADVTVPPTQAVGPVALVPSSPFGSAAPVTLAIERFPAVMVKGASDSITTAMTVPLDTVLAGSLDRAGDVDYFRFVAKSGQPVGVAADAKFTPILTLSAPDGTILSESTNGSLGVVCPVDGTYGLAIRDRDYRGGAGMTYRVSVGAVPVVTGLFPPVVTKGRQTTVRLLGVHLSPEGFGNSVWFDISKDESRKTIDLSRWLNCERPFGTTTVAVESLPTAVVKGDKAFFPSVPGAADGILGSPGSSLTVTFDAKAGESLVVEGLARRYGSPVDPSIEILDAAGKPVPRVTLRCVAKTFLTFRDHDAAKPGLRLETWNELAANDLLLIGNELVKIQQLPGHPDSDCDFFNVGGKRTSFLDTTNSHHALNSPMYKVEVHPAGAAFPPNGMPVIRLDYRNDDGGPGYGKDARLFFTAPADGEYRVRLSDARGFGGPNHVARVIVRPPVPAVVASFLPVAPNVWKGGTIPVTVNVERIDGFDGPVRVELTDMPKGFTSAPGLVGAGFHTTTLGLSAAPDAVSSDTPLSLVARYDVNGETKTVRLTGKPATVADMGEIVTTTKQTSLTITPGRETRFVVAVERRNGFKGRIPVDVRGLPHGVTVQNIGLNKIMITETETEREVVLRAEPWVEPMTVPLVVVAVREGKSAESAAKPLPLTVTP